jgi:ligand-binding sensor domain-containing protein/signal transduction histidine kinase
MCEGSGHTRLLPVVIVWLGLLPSLAANAAAQHRFDSWTTENGLPQNSVNDILQTRDGYLWLATHGGLVRFDGMRFVIFDRSTQGIESQRVRALHEDRQGALWAATEDGMLIRYRNGRFVTYTSKDGLPHAVAVRIEEDDEGCLWVTWAGSMTKFDGQRFVDMKPEHFANRVAAPPRARYHDVWWTQDSIGLHVLVKGRVQTVSVRSELNGAGITGVIADRRGNLWIHTRGAGVIKVSDGRLRRYTTRDGMPSNDPDGAVHEGHDGELWVADRDKVYRIKDGKPESFKLPGAPISGLRSFLVDDEGSVWLGTTASGLHRFSDASISVHAERDGVSLVGAYSILADRTGAIWIGSNGLKRYANSRFTSSWSTAGTSRDQVTSIYEDTAGTLWVGTAGGLRYFRSGRFTPYEDPSGLLNGSISAIHEDRSGTFWFATDSGLVQSTGGRFTRYTTAEGLSHDRITALFEDRRGALWIGTLQGLTRLKNGAFTAYREHDGFIGSWVRAFHEDSDGILWVGTYDGGLYRLANERLTRFTRNEGLHDNGVFQILEDADGFFWMGSNRGISRISRRELIDVAEGRRRTVTPVVFGVRDGLSSVEVNGGRQPAGLKTADGKLWFPTMGGVAVIDPAAIRIKAKPPFAVIEAVRLNGDRVDSTGEIRVPPSVRALEIEYTAPGFVKPEQIRFRYRLTGLDGLEDEWIEAGARRSVGFHGMSPGRYRFEVIAASHDGVWTTAGSSVEIVVVPPFWRTWWFIALAVAGAASIALAGHERRVRGLRRLHTLQEEFSRQLIDSQERERRRVSNEMHDSLGQHVAIIKRTARTSRETVTDQAAVGEAFDEIAALAERINGEMTEIAYDMRPHQLDTIGLSKTIESMVRRVGRTCDIQLTPDIASIDDAIPEASQIHVFRIVQEAVSNIVKHSDATCGKVIIARGVTSLEIRVHDDGTGFSSESLDAVRSTAHGAGLVGIRERARILGGQAEIQSSAQTGTTVAVTLPLGGTTRRAGVGPREH